MDHQPRWSNKPHRRFADRLDRASRDINVVLLVFAIGLAVLDFTCFSAFVFRHALAEGQPLGAPTQIVAQALIAASAVPAASRPSRVHATDSSR